MFGRGSVSVCSVNHLQAGDLIAYEFLGTVVSGKITKIPFSWMDLSDEEAEYLSKYVVRRDDHQMFAHTHRLLLGRFEGGGPVYNHGFVKNDLLVAVFPTKEN